MKNLDRTITLALLIAAMVVVNYFPTIAASFRGLVRDMTIGQLIGVIVFISILQ